MRHELQVHQIELEMQNEKLRDALHDQEHSLANYLDLYDLAPIGYPASPIAGDANFDSSIALPAGGR